MEWLGRLVLIFVMLLTGAEGLNAGARHRIRDLGVVIGILPPGANNAITDVQDLRVGQVTLWQGDSVRTGVTAIIPHPGNLFREKVPAAVVVGNGFGKLTGVTQVEELGNLETPLILTNTLSVPTAAGAVIDYTLAQAGNAEVRSVNTVVGETNDGWLNDIRGRHLTAAHVLEAIARAAPGPVAEGAVGAGTGTVCFGFKGGIGTASRVVPEAAGGYTVGVLMQTNFGGVLQVAGVPVGVELGRYYLQEHLSPESPDGSCMIVVATDAPLTARNLERLARRALLGLGKTGGIMSNGSGDYVIAFSTAEAVRVAPVSPALTRELRELTNAAMSPLFLAVSEATEEAILNSLCMAETVSGWRQHTAEALPLDEVVKILKRYGRIR